MTISLPTPDVCRVAEAILNRNNNRASMSAQAVRRIPLRAVRLGITSTPDTASNALPLGQWRVRRGFAAVWQKRTSSVTRG
ncbi:hypothetical protein KCP78_10040 [Salmonella enterica subsp. enterica]|nr:hypothetical protein KCP78_10040 [Salmonella enterica subsp. enterica]